MVRLWYYKDAAGTGGDDTVWVAAVTLPDTDGTVVRFDTPGLPPGWSGLPVPGPPPTWSVADDPAHSAGLGRYVIRPPSLGDRQAAAIQSNTFALSPGKRLSITAWVSSEKGTEPPKPSPFDHAGDEGDWFFIEVLNPSNAQRGSGLRGRWCSG